MPRWNRRARAAKPPKPPAPPKLARPKVKNLRMVYKGILSVSIGDRIAALHYGLQWYDGVVTYLLSKKLIPLAPANQPTPEQKRLALAVKARNQAAGTTIDFEKESALLLAIKSYEIACAAIKPIKVEKFYDLFNKKKAVLEAKQQRLEQKFGAIFGLMQKVVGSRFKITTIDAQKPMQYNPNLTTLNYNREASKALALQYKAEGFLPVFASQANVFARNASLQPDGAGGFLYDAEKHNESLVALMVDLVAFLKTSDAPRKGQLIRNGVAPAPQAPKAPRVPGAPRAAAGPRGKGPRVLGFIIPGTAIHKAYENLADQQWHTMAAAIVGVNNADPAGRVKQLQRYGREKGTFDVEFDATKGVRLQLKPGVTP